MTQLISLCYQKQIPKQSLSTIEESGKIKLLAYAKEQDNVFDSQFSQAIIWILNSFKNNNITQMLLCHVYF